MSLTNNAEQGQADIVKALQPYGRLLRTRHWRVIDLQRPYLVDDAARECFVRAVPIPARVPPFVVFDRIAVVVEAKSQNVVGWIGYTMLSVHRRPVAVVCDELAAPLSRRLRRVKARLAVAEWVRHRCPASVYVARLTYKDEPAKPAPSPEKATDIGHIAESLQSWLASIPLNPDSEPQVAPSTGSLQIAKINPLLAASRLARTTQRTSRPTRAARRAQAAINVEDIRTIARRRLRRDVFDLIDGGAGDESTLRANRTAFSRITFRPRVLRDVSDRDLSTTVFGQRVSMPVLLAPTGAPGLVHTGAELSVARAAGRAGVVYVQSTAGSVSVEEVAMTRCGPLWFQLYVAKDRDRTAALVDRVAAAGYQALCVTVDNAVLGARERDLRHERSRSAIARGLAASLGARLRRGELSKTTIDAARVIKGRGAAATWEDLAWIRDRWQGPLVIKGVMSGSECSALLAAGADGVIVSNHGGRQLDSLPASIEVLPEIVHAMGNRGEVYVDGGFRRGVDVAKALALGARACLIGRPYVYGLAAAGEDGVFRVLEIVRDELDRSMALLGCATIADLDTDVIRHNFQPIEGSLPLGAR